MNYRPEIDGLRALAVLPVIFFHAGFDAFSGGFVGVDVFFVISGYLITTIILADLERGKFSIIEFYERRARRILPALFLVMLVTLPFAWFWLLPGDMKDYSQSLLAVSLFISNILFWRESGYFDTVADLKPLLHTWSLSVEEQFYVIFPLLLLVFWKYGRYWISFLLTLIFLSSLLLAQWMSLAYPSAAFFLLPTRMWELLIGAFAALYFSEIGHKNISKSWRELAGWTGIGLIAYATVAYNKTTPFPGFYALVPTVGAVLMILFATQNTMIGRLMGHRVLVGVGMLSYSAYLWHQPLFAFARHRVSDTTDSLLFLLLISLTLSLSYLSWRYVETPFRNRVKFSRKMIFTLAGVFTAFFVVIGYFIQKNDGYENRFVRTLQGDIGHVEFHDHHNQYFDCKPDTVASNALRWGEFLRCKQSRQGLPDVILLGDSHAEHLFLGVAEYAPDTNLAFYIMGGEPYLHNPQFRVIFDELLSNGRQQHVVLTMHYLMYLDAKGTGLYDGFLTTVKALLAAGKTVTILGDVPRFSYEPGFCLYAKSSKFSESCYLSIADVGLQKRVYEPILQRLSTELGIRYLSIDSPMCSLNRCSIVVNDAVIYRDKNHLNIIGSRLIGKYLVNQLSL
jgi:peptidoglycan/LPS O-acetylase OafA/YrhL